MAGPGAPGKVIVPPSESGARELSKIRYMDSATSPESPLRPIGNWRMAAVGASVVVVLALAAWAILFAQLGEVHVSLSNVTVTPGTCRTDPGGAPIYSTMNYSYTLSNTGTRDAYVALDLYANGQRVGTQWAVYVPAGSHVDTGSQAIANFCDVSQGAVQIRSITPV